MFEFLVWLCVLLLPLLARFIIGLAMLWMIVVTMGPPHDVPLMPGYGLLGLAVAAVLSVVASLALPYMKASLSSTRWRHAFWVLSLAAIAVVMALICNVGDANSPQGTVAILCICLAFGERVVQFNDLRARPEPIANFANVNANAPTTANSPAPFCPAKATKTFENIGGMSGLKAELREAMAPFSTGRSVPDRNGVLLYGPPGNGKTLVAEAMAGELGFGFMKLTAADMTSKWLNESGQIIAAAFSAAIQAAPCVVFIDEIDAVGFNRSTGSSHVEDTKVLTTLLTQINRLREHRVLLVGATNLVESLDPALIRDGRFDFRIEVPNPDAPARLAILRDVAHRHGVAVDDSTAMQLTASWEQRSAAFIEGVVKRVRDVLRREARTAASLADFKKADRATSRNEGAIPKSGVKLSELFLPDPARAEAESLVFRLKSWEATVAQGGTPPKGVLLAGPPGTGKTNLVRAIARELADWHLFEVKTSEILADPRRFKDVMAKASQHRPAIVFMDEADELLKDRGYSANATATNEVLTAMDGVMGAVPEIVFMAATNNADAIDAAAKRGGRFSEKVYLDRLQGRDLHEFVKRDLARRTQVSFATDVSATSIAAIVGESSPADVVAILDKAINYTFTASGRREVELDDVERAMQAMHSL